MNTEKNYTQSEIGEIFLQHVEQKTEKEPDYEFIIASLKDEIAELKEKNEKARTVAFEEATTVARQYAKDIGFSGSEADALRDKIRSLYQLECYFGDHE